MIGDNAISGWRYIGLAVRTAMELGLNLRRKVEQSFPDARERKDVQTLFWSIYILDQCWSLHLGFEPASRRGDPEIGIPEPVCCTLVLSCSEIC